MNYKFNYERIVDIEKALRKHMAELQHDNARFIAECERLREENDKLKAELNKWNINGWWSV